MCRIKLTILRSPVAEVICDQLFALLSYPSRLGSGYVSITRSRFSSKHPQLSTRMADNPSSLKFHPDFSTSHRDSVILQAEDGVCFHYNSDNLAKNSEFFRDTFTNLPLPLLADTASASRRTPPQSTIIPLPSIGADSTYLLLALLAHDKDKLIKIRTDYEDNVPQLGLIVQEVLHAADMFFIDEVVPKLSERFCDGDDFIRFALFSGSGCDQKARSLSMALADQTLADISALARSVLEAVCPDDFELLLELMERHGREGWSIVKKGLRVSSDPLSKGDDNGARFMPRARRRL